MKLKISDIELALAKAKYKLGDIQGANETFVNLINRYPKCMKIAKEYSTFLENSANKETIKVDYTKEHEVFKFQ